MKASKSSMKASKSSMKASKSSMTATAVHLLPQQCAWVTDASSAYRLPVGRQGFLSMT